MIEASKVPTEEKPPWVLPDTLPTRTIMFDAEIVPELKVGETAKVLFFDECNKWKHPVQGGAPKVRGLDNNCFYDSTSIWLPCGYEVYVRSVSISLTDLYRREIDAEKFIGAHGLQIRMIYQRTPMQAVRGEDALEKASEKEGFVLFEEPQRFVNMGGGGSTEVTLVAHNSGPEPLPPFRAKISLHGILERASL